MSGGALRVLFAELGFEVDEAALLAADARVHEVAQSMQALVSMSGETGQAITAAARVADEAFAGVKAAAGRASEAIEAQFLDVEGLREAMAAARAEGLAASAGPSVVIADDLKEEVAQLDAAAKATRELAAEEQKRREAPAKRAQDERADHAAQKAFNDSDAGKAHAAWKRTRDAEEAAKKPASDLAGVTARTQKKVTDAFGRAMPEAVQRFAERLGIARDDTEALGRVVVGVSQRAAMALAGLVIGVAAFSASFAAESEALRETAREARVTSSELQALQHAGAQSGVGADRVTSSITALGQKLRDANNHLPGSGGTVHMLRRLGITARDASGQIRPTVDILDDVAVAMEHVSSPRRRIRIAEALGLDRRMLDILHTGEGGIRALRDEMRELGGGVTPEATEAARRFAQQQERVRVSLTSVRSSIFAQLGPTLTDLMQRTSTLLGWFARVTRGTHFFEHAVRNLGVVLAVAAVPAVAAWSPLTFTFGAIAAAVLVAALAFDDIQGLLEGHNSLIGELVDRYAGAGTAARWVLQLRDAWNGVVDAMARLNEHINRMPTWARRMFDVGTLGVRHLFGDERSQGAAGGTVPAPPAAVPAPPSSQPSIPAANLAAWGASRPVYAPVVPATHTVPMARTGGTTIHQTTTREGDRINVTINGDDPAAMRRDLLRLLDERERRRNNDRSPREGA